MTRANQRASKAKKTTIKKLSIKYGNYNNRVISINRRMPRNPDNI